MAFDFPKFKRNSDETYGPTNNNKFYKSVSYHKKNAKKSKDKTRWIISENGEYFTFKISDENDWICDECKKYFSIINKGNEILGENGERLAIFLQPKNSNEVWHGFPIFSSDFAPSSDLLDVWEGMAVIPYHVRLKIENRKL